MWFGLSVGTTDDRPKDGHADGVLSAGPAVSRETPLVPDGVRGAGGQRVCAAAAAAGDPREVRQGRADVRAGGVQEAGVRGGAQGVAVLPGGVGDPVLSGGVPEDDRLTKG